MIKYFTRFHPKHFLFNTFEKNLTFEKKIAQMAFYKKNIFAFAKTNSKTNPEIYDLCVSAKNTISFFEFTNAKRDLFILKNCFNSGLNLYFEDEKSVLRYLKKTIENTEKAAFYVLLDCYFQNQTSEKLSAILKETIFRKFNNNQLISFWIENFLKINKYDFEVVMYVLERDMYSNEVTIALGKRALRTIEFKNNYFLIYYSIGNCYYYANNLKSALFYFNKAKKHLPTTDVHNHFLFYFKLTKIKKALGLDYEFEKDILICLYLSKEAGDRKLYRNDMKHYFKTAV